jgi:hypothetical protein
MADALLTAELVIDANKRTWRMTGGTLRQWLGTLTKALLPSVDDASNQQVLKAQWNRFPFESLLYPPHLHDRKDATRKKDLPSWWDHPEKALLPAGTGKSQRLGFILRQFYSLLEERRDEKQNEGTFKARFRRIHDLRMLSASTTASAETRTNPPLLYIGDWSHEQGDALQMELTAAAAVWADPKCRSACQLWLRQGQSPKSRFAFGIPPLRVYDLEVFGKYKWNDQRCTLSNVELRITLPHAWKADLVGRLPSLLTITCTGHDCTNDKPQTLLVASPHLRRVAADLSEIWEDQSLRRILLIAPPGSGKEILAGFLHAGVKFYAPVKKRCPACTKPLAEASFVGISPADAARTLYGEAVPKRDAADDAVQLGHDLAWRFGLLQQACGTVVFIDEIDKASVDLRASLLRFLENDDIQPHGYPMPIKLEEDKVGDTEVSTDYRARLLFAGSKTREDMFNKEGPPDFWTRMLRVIEMAHPFQIHDLSEREICVAEYFLMFLYRTVSEHHFKGQDPTVKNYFRWVIGKSNMAPAKRMGAGPFDDKYPLVYLMPAVARKLSLTVAQFLGEMPTTTLSVRNLNALVKRLDYHVRLIADRGIDLKGAKRTVKADDARSKGARTLKAVLMDQDWVWAKLHETAVSLLH